MMSSMCSIPMLSRIISGRTPALSCSSRDIWRWVVEAMAGQRFRIAHVNQALDELERVVAFLSRGEAAAHAESQQRAGTTAEILAGQRVIGALRKSDIVDPLHSR